MSENDIERLAIESSVIPEEALEDLLRCLKQRDFQWLVTDASSKQDRLQGDIFDRIPIILIGRQEGLVSHALRAMVLNTACDLEPNRSQILTFAPIQSFKNFARVVERAQRDKARSFLESVRANEVDELLYLPPCPQLSSDSVVHLNQMGPVASAEYEAALKDHRRIASLTDNGYYFLLMKLTRFFVRPGR